MSIEERLTRIERIVLIGSKNVLDTSEVAMMLNISESRVRHLVSERSIPHYKQGVKTFFRKSEIEEWQCSQRIPTNKEIIRQDLDDAVFGTQKAKYKAIIDRICEVHATGQPVLVGTVSIEISELLSEMLNKRGVPHSVLNAKKHEKEAQIVAEAGKKDAVTIAANMAGRGTDIILGGNPKTIRMNSSTRHVPLFPQMTRISLRLMRDSLN